MPEGEHLDPRRAPGNPVVEVIPETANEDAANSRETRIASDRADLNESIRFVLLDTRPRRLHKHLVTKTISTFGIT